MSDYLYSSTPQIKGVLSAAINNIYLNSLPCVQEFHGKWGSLAVSESLYSGFRPYETEQHLMVVIGGPVLYFRNNDFLMSEDSSEATQSIYQRWIFSKNIQWDEDLSGPFNILFIDKSKQCIKIITDLMAFIPVYTCQRADSFYLGTHVDALATVAGEEDNFDSVSLADFVLNEVITYPYTAYENIRQIAPSSQTTFMNSIEVSDVKSYWEPKEFNIYSDIQTAAETLRAGLEGYINRVTSKMDEIAQFISAGEDSRALSGMLPNHLQRDGYVFLDHMNREGKIAEKVAAKYGANFIVGLRSKTHYLEILPEACKLVGIGHQYHHAHSLGFDKQYRLSEYPAVFGGYLSDSLLKSPYALKRFNVKSDRFSFIAIPEFFKKGETQTKRIDHPVIKNEIIDKIFERRATRFENIKQLRPVTAHEWFVLYPATMRVAIPNLYTTRRLFRSYEPFMCKESVKISAAVPTQWKMNRRLFNRAVKPYLEPTKWLLHGDGRLPYFSWVVNIPLQTSIRFYRRVATRAGLIKGNQGPWGDWLQASKSLEWEKATDKYSESLDDMGFLADGKQVREILMSDTLSLSGRITLLQVVFHKAQLNIKSQLQKNL